MQVENGTQGSDISIEKENVRKEGWMCTVINKWRNLLMEKEYIDGQVE
jgi:hypothetical protein